MRNKKEYIDIKSRFELIQEIIHVPWLCPICRLDFLLIPPALPPERTTTTTPTPPSPTANQSDHTETTHVEKWHTNNNNNNNHNNESDATYADSID